jgi:hypothetical protein
MKTTFCLSENDLKNAGVRAKATDYVQGHHWELRRRGKGMQLWWHESMLDPEWRVAPVVTPPAVTPETPVFAVEAHNLELHPDADTVEILLQKIAELEQESLYVEEIFSVYEAEVLKEKYPNEFVKNPCGDCESSITTYEVVKKLCRNERFVILTDNTPVRTGKMLGRIRPGMRVIVRNGTIVKG